MSEDQLKTLLWVMGECGTPNVPTFSQLRRVQAKQGITCHLEPELHTSAMGNQFYMNNPLSLLAMVRLWCNSGRLAANAAGTV